MAFKKTQYTRKQRDQGCQTGPKQPHLFFQQEPVIGVKRIGKINESENAGPSGRVTVPVPLPAP